jgi:hypothetical protein
MDDNGVYKPTNITEKAPSCRIDVKTMEDL